ncbi:MAG TPA: serine hydroxymethyltransferase [Bacilli bacterium]|jgi:glycine hydroxymethyltransferase|nr:MAG: Serine hydroxymethyltransferase [Tenericutes bacterium ADurb.Bin140]HOE77169.1 serine hydroxymethyltransferase [Bacilli bacterium]HON63268.1 serine hydroxymethyltransferase [Bacilli bacterium]HOR96136.1 serine hydroxymethyltransferase [Bacilli bacterium]HPK59192.1 serine hydroxymethyltransferase [Bacilli bacterium]
MKNIITFIAMILGFFMFIGLYLVTVLVPDTLGDILVVVGSYVSVLLFGYGITYFAALIGKPLRQHDEEIYLVLKAEKKRQKEHLELIASENYVSRPVLKVTGSVLTNKYAEGYPGRRYYGGCENVDAIETIAIERAKQLFNAKFANVQPHSGSQANSAAYRALLNIGDVVLGMSLEDGGHLTHGHKMSFSGQDYVFYSYHVGTDGFIDYEEVRRLAREVKPKLIVAGASAYPRKIDFAKFREIADEVGAYLMVDMAHIAGLVAAGYHQNPIDYAHIVTSTTHKTLRGPRGGIILTNDEKIAKKVNQTVFPGIQGGPLMHVIAAKAVSFLEAMQPEFKEYIAQVVKNANILAEELKIRGYRLISGGTDNHLVLVDVKSKTGMTGKECEALLEKVNITCNKNTIPHETEKPAYASGIRLGTPALTTRGMKEKEMVEIAGMIDEVLTHPSDEALHREIKKRVVKLAQKFPTHPHFEHIQ